MGIADRYSLEAFKALINDRFTPSDVIRTPSRLYGRNSILNDIERTFGSPGRHVFLFGDRGVGKSSVAETAAYKLTDHGDPIVVQCTRNITLFEIVRDIASRTYKRDVQFGPNEKSKGFRLGFEGLSFSGSVGNKEKDRAPTPTTINQCFELLRFLDDNISGQLVVVLDEFDRIEKDETVSDFAEFIKGLNSLSDTGIKFIFCGIFATLEDIITRHGSTGRVFKTIELPKVIYGELFEIIQPIAKELGVDVPTGYLIRIAVLSDRFPHFVHLFGMSLFWNLFDKNFGGDKISYSEYEQAVHSTLQEAEGELKFAYEKAVRKVKLYDDYEHVLWAFSDRGETILQSRSVYQKSYLNIVKQLDLPDDQIMDGDAFVRRVQNLKNERHGCILVPAVGKSGWFRFKENRIRGYCRLLASQSRVELCADWISELENLVARGMPLDDDGRSGAV